MRIPPSAPPILRLPQELLDDTLSRIDLHVDLINFALASKACSRLVIPRHSQYRVIRIRHIYPHLWEHLACRADLAMNVREVHICQRQDYTAPDHWPTTLLKGCASRQKEPFTDWSTVARNLGAALMHMRNLHTFSWAWDHSSVTWTVNDKLGLEYRAFDALSQLPNLQHLALHNFFILRLPTWEGDRTYPLWSTTNLTSLCLSGDTWTKPDHRPHIVSLLQNSPNLRHLDIPMEFQPLASLNFPKLEELRLVLQSGSSYSIDESRARFIERHPTIKKLYWTPILNPPLSPNCLPNLRLLRSSNDVIRTLNSGSCVRTIESLEVIVLTRELLETISKCFDRGSLKRIRILNFDDLTTLRALAVTFPAITHLSLPPHFISDIRRVVDLQSWMELLPLFTNLEVFHGLGVWQAVEMDKGRMHQAIHNIVELCPHLQELDHHQFYSKRLSNNRIVISREVTADEERIGYSVRKPRFHQSFQTAMEGCF